MPFTPTHILAILPIAAIKRWPLPFSALVIGSMIPDFPLFVPFSPGYGVTHSLLGVLTTCLPLGLACDLIFQLLLKRPLSALLPEAIQRRCAPHAMRRMELSLKSLAFASLAIVAGACTHLFWDTFSHRGRWGTQLLPQLNQTALTIAGHAVPGYKVLQYGSTFVGLPCLLLLLAVWLYRQPPASLDGCPVLSRTAKVIAYLITVAIPMTVTLLVWRQRDLSQYNRLGQAITTSGLALMIATLIFCLTFRAVEGRLAQPK